MKRSVLSILVENQFGVLSRVTGLFSRRGFSIDSLSVGVTEDTNVSRITITVIDSDDLIDQIIKQVEKLVEVIEVVQLDNEESVCREIALIKVKTTDANRTEIVGMVDIFRANIVDVAKESVIIEMTGDSKKVDVLVNLLMEYGIVEMTRTGVTALSRGSKDLALK
ncbi:MAG: acetolactate synthase small subunit [Lachnospirales bacterium]